MRKKLILFDLDGTVMNTKEGITKCAAYALEHYGIHVEDPDCLDFFIGPPLHTSFSRFYGFDEQKAIEATALYRERYKDIGIFECEPYQGMEECIRNLYDAGYILGLATSKPEVFAERILEKFGLKPYFTHITGSLLDNSRTDKKEVIEEAFCRFGVDEIYQRSEILMVGDREHDVIGAKKTGIESMGVKFGFAKGNELEEAGAEYIAETPTDIFRIIKKMEAE
ncbi:MAG: HAD hydrolase-like protein [Lachnospiraceae bacterium]|nr:HAD hydrolase-like protein [Lachnospiraceae bacterium]